MTFQTTIYSLQKDLAFHKKKIPAIDTTTGQQCGNISSPNWHNSKAGVVDLLDIQGKVANSYYLYVTFDIAS